MSKKTFIEYSVNERKRIFKLWQVVSECGTNPENLAEAYDIDQDVLNEIIADGILQAQRRSNEEYIKFKTILTEKYLVAFRNQVGIKNSPFSEMIKRQQRIKEGTLMIIQSVTEHNIFFDNGKRISWTNNCNNTPEDYADFAVLGDSVVGKEFDTDLKFLAADNSGFFFGNDMDNALFVPCYAYHSEYDKINVYYDGEQVLKVVPRDMTEPEYCDYEPMIKFFQD